MAPVKKPHHARAKHFLREWREFKKLSQEDAADRAEIDRTSLSKVENGKVPYNQDLLERLALAYGCDPDDLISMDPLKLDPPRLVYNQLRHAPPELQRQAANIIAALLKAS